MTTDNPIPEQNQIQQLRALATKYRVCWEVYPDKVVDAGQLQQDGYRLELYGTHVSGTDHVDPGCCHCLEVWNALRSIAESIMPKDHRDSQYEISGFDRGIHYSRARNARPDVELHIRISHRNGFGPVDACEVRCLSEMKEKLQELGTTQEHWHSYRSGSAVKKLLAIFLLALSFIAHANAPGASGFGPAGSAGRTTES